MQIRENQPVGLWLCEWNKGPKPSQVIAEADGLTNLLARPKDERLKKETLKRDLSNDLYSTLSQQVFNAKLQADVQQLRNGTQSVQP